MKDIWSDSDIFLGAKLRFQVIKKVGEEYPVTVHEQTLVQRAFYKLLAAHP